jgi:NAD kinase
MAASRKLVVVTRKTALEELVERFNTRDQARFYIEHMGGAFAPYQEAHDAYRLAVEHLRRHLPKGLRSQWIERAFLPTFTFAESDVVLVLGQDGLVVNAAKYLNGQPVVAVNPDPARIDGVLLPFGVEQAAAGIERALKGGRRAWASITMAQATLNDGQTIRAVNDLFIGQKTHVSARYRIAFDGLSENQSSSGIIVSTGAGSTGWLRSIVAGAVGITAARLKSPQILKARDDYRFNWEWRELVFSVREPFASKTSAAEIVHGTINRDRPLGIASLMPQNGVIFGDGVEADYLEFNSGAIARIEPGDRVLRLVRP